MRYAAHAAPIALRALRATSFDGDYLAQVQHRRLGTVVRHARRSSPFFRHHMRDLPDELPDITAIAPTRKRDLMAAFDDWVTDPRLRLDRITDEFLSRPELVGQKYLGRYRVFTTSGTTGHPAVVIHDPSSWLVLQLVSRLRSWPVLSSHGLTGTVMHHGLRSASVFATGGHYGGAALAAAAQGVHPALSRRVRVVSVLEPMAQQVDELNDFQPTFMSGYPSAMLALAEEQRAGRLSIAPSIMLCAGEHLGESQRSLLESTFGGHVLLGYAASEAPALALECDAHRFHVNTDWYVLEPVDLDMNPVPAGTISDTCLVTNLSNFVQPIIRYDLGDRVLMHPDQCSCGSRLPSVSVEGRTNDLVVLDSVTGSSVSLLPLAVTSVIEEVPGVERCQVVNPDATTIEVRLDTTGGSERTRVEEQVVEDMDAFLRMNGVVARCAISADRPQAEPSGKVKQVISWSPVPAA